MANFYQAKFSALNKIQVVVFSEIRVNNPSFVVLEGDRQIKSSISRRTSTTTLYFYELTLQENISLDKQYFISINNLPMVIVNNSDASNFPEFDSLFNYNGKDLGYIYSKDKTDFALWAPLASEVLLCIDGKELPMERSEKGVYRISCKGNNNGKEYVYKVTNNGVTLTSLDPYAYACNVNSTASVIIDLEEVKKLGTVDPGFITEKYTDAIIYELHVRDFTEDPNTDIVHKGTYEGLAEPNRKTKGGNPAGLDYLKFLGITHVQLQPIQDYRGVDDLTHKGYNWGYDPIHYFNLEGSISSNPTDPVARMKEFKNMVNVLHKNHIKVNVDVVYNHIYEYRTSIFEKIVPGYYFRKRKNGEIYASSGCGNDFASEKFMVRKLILDSLKFLVDLYDIDGYRFDLMGLLDKDTLNLAYNDLSKRKKDIMMYGEGWNMMSTLQVEEKGCSENAKNLPNYAFFNDMYRDIMKGGNSLDRIHVKGFCNGDISYKFGFDYCFLGSVLHHSYDPRFGDACQSLNYVECHDNNTLFDKYLITNADEELETILRRICFTNAIVLTSIGIPFIHMGQEIGQSKRMMDNTYNIEKVNNMDWNLVDERFAMVTYFNYLVTLRKTLPFLRENNPDVIENLYTKYEDDNGQITYSVNKPYLGEYKGLFIDINPSKESIPFEYDEDLTLLTFKGENIKYRGGLSMPLSLTISYLK